MLRANFAKYSGSQTERAALFYLQREFNFLEQIEGTPRCYRFKRADQVTIDYYETMLDSTHAAIEHPAIDVWLQNLTRPAANHLIIAPLVLVNKRKHFNTLVIYSDAQLELHIYIIEPRSNNLSLGFFRLFYPITTLIDKLSAFFFGSKVHNLKIGTQDLFDDVTCGPQHVNFVEIISHMHAAVLSSPNKIEDALQLTSLVARIKDKEHIEVIANANPRISHGRKEDQGQAMAALNATLNASHSEEVKTQMVSRLIIRLAQYQNRVTSNFSLFGGHTRHLTATKLLNMIEAIEATAESIDMKLYKMGLLIFGAFVTINSSNSKLRSLLAEGLAFVLNCTEEYALLTKQNPTDYEPLAQLFRQRLLAKRFEANSNISNEQFAKILDWMSDINEGDSSLWYKVSNGETINKNRDELFAKISNELGLNSSNGLSQNCLV